MANELLASYREHLRLDRNLSENSIRAYIADLESLLEHINKLGVTEFKDLTIDHLRSWLANLQTRGAARSSLSRRTVSIKAFTYWGAKNGWLSRDIGKQLQSPKPQRRLPDILDIEGAITTLDSLAVRVSEEGSSAAMRDRAIVETLYASGIRVSELSGLNLNDIDFSRNTLRVSGKGNKERTVPIGIPAAKALTDSTQCGKPARAAKNRINTITGCATPWMIKMRLGPSRSMMRPMKGAVKAMAKK